MDMLAVHYYPLFTKAMKRTAGLVSNKVRVAAGKVQV